MGRFFGQILMQVFTNFRNRAVFYSVQEICTRKTRTRKHVRRARFWASVCLSVCPSVTLVDQDHIGWKSWKLTARTISPTPSLFVAQRTSTYSQGNMGKFGGD